MRDGKTQIVYVLKNPAMPDLVKIGVTSRKEVMKRITELSRQTGVPLPFECSYAGEVSAHSKNVEKLMQKVFAAARVPSGKEFFSIDCDQAIAALALANAVDVTPQFQIEPSSQERKAIAVVRRAKRSNTILDELRIPRGTKLVLKKGHNIHCTSIGGNKVRFRGRVLSLSAAALEGLRGIGYKTLAASGPGYWTLNGKSLSKMMREKNQKKKGAS
jgi:T5orf172 domain